MKNGIFTYLKPAEKLGIVILVSIFSQILLGLLALEVAQLCYGIRLDDFENNLWSENKIAAQKMMSVFFQIGTFLLPAITAAKWFAFDSSDYLIKEKLKISFLPTLLLFIVGMTLTSQLFSILNNWIPEYLIPQDIIDAQENTRNTINLFLSTQNSLWTNIFVMALIPAFCEEFFFRGILLHLLAKWSGKIHLSIWITAIIFAALHFQYCYFLPMVIIGSLLGYLVVLTKSLIPAIIAHFFNNSLVLVIDYIEKTTEHSISESQIYATSILGIFILAYAIYLISKKSKWHETKGLYTR